jgi:hypothetical protein
MHQTLPAALACGDAIALRQALEQADAAHKHTTML